jgi:hypothetical protein
MAGAADRLRIALFGLRYIRFRSNSRTRASSGAIVAHFAPTPNSAMACAASIVTWSSVVSRHSMPRLKYFRSMSTYDRMSLSLMNPQMMRVISSPSSSTTEVFTLIFAILSSSKEKWAGFAAPGRPAKRPDIRIRPCPERFQLYLAVRNAYPGETVAGCAAGTTPGRTMAPYRLTR